MPDFAYDHLTGDFTAMNGTLIGTVDASRWFYASDPTELDCMTAKKWGTMFTEATLKYAKILACVRTAEGDVGYIHLEPDLSERPTAYYMYSYVWVRS